MAPSTIRKAIGAVKDQTSISIAKVAGTTAPHIEVLVVKATSHDEEPADDKYFREIVNLTLYSRKFVSVCVSTISKRLSKTRDWIVALKALMLVHRLLVDGHPKLEKEIVYATRKGMRVLNMSGFRDEAHSNSWDHAGFVRCYAMYLDEKVELVVFERKSRDKEERVGDKLDGFGSYRRDERRIRDDFESGMRSSSYGDVNESIGREQEKESTPIKEMKPERILGKLGQLLRILARVLACRPSGMAKDSRLVFVALYHVVKESFALYVEICEVLGVLLDRFTEMEYENCLRGFDTYLTAAKLIDELILLYDWCKDVGIARSSEFPEVKRVTVQLLGTLEGFLKEMSSRGKNPEIIQMEKAPVKEEQEINMNEMKALPAPENQAPNRSTTPPEPQQPKPQPQQVVVTEELVNLKDDVSADEQGYKLALALFSGQPAVNANGAWETFPSNGEPELTSAWQTPAAETGKADWELALAESASNLSKQKATMGGGFDLLLLNGMYDQGAVRQHVSNTQLSGGSSSNVVLPGLGKNGTTQFLALPAPDGSLQPVGNQDPFAASLLVPPPSYVQMAEMERKQQLLVQEQLIWQQHGMKGMQGQVGYYNHGMVQPGGYHSTRY